MRAVWLKELGGPEVLVPGDAPDPEVGPEQVLVEVAFAGITFVETQMRATGFGPFPLELPMIPGNGVSGVVSVVGERIDRIAPRRSRRDLDGRVGWVRRAGGGRRRGDPRRPRGAGARRRGRRPRRRANGRAAT